MFTDTLRLRDNVDLICSSESKHQFAMGEPEKKFAFGFSKVVKKTNLVIPPVPSKEKSSDVQFIDCIEAQSIKLRDGEEKETGPLVIPLVGPRKSSTLINGKTIAEIAEDFSEPGESSKQVQQNDLQAIGSAASLDAIAAREILQEASGIKVQESQTLESLPALENAENKDLQKESTLEDYENVPVSQFGLAMLRGMGWKAGEGIGKNKQVVPVSAPVVRPKGLGLGAEKVLSTPAPGKSLNNKEEELKVIKGAYVMVIGGSHKGQYAQVEGFTDDAGRAILKMAIGGHVVSINEASIYPVSKSEYSKNSKVINALKFEEFKKKEGKEEKRIMQPQRGDTTKANESSTPSVSSKKEQAFSTKSHSRTAVAVKEYESDSSSESLKRRENTSRRLKSRSRSPSYKRQDGKSHRHRSRSISPRSKNKNSRGRDRSRTRDSSTKKYSSDSDDASYSQRRSRDKDSHRKQRQSSSDSEGIPIKSRRKKKGKKCRRSYSRSPSRRRRK